MKIRWSSLKIPSGPSWAFGEGGAGDRAATRVSVCRRSPLRPDIAKVAAGNSTTTNATSEPVRTRPPEDRRRRGRRPMGRWSLARALPETSMSDGGAPEPPPDGDLFFGAAHDQARLWCAYAQV